MERNKSDAPASLGVSRRVALIAPVYNEEGGIEEFVRRCQKAVEGLPYSFSFTLVNDGSTDRTLEKLFALQATSKLPMKIVQLSRNFGHANALTAGIEQSDADVYIILDADLQDPPELIQELLLQYEAGKHVVYTVKTRREDSAFRRLAFRCFHAVFSKITNLNIPEGSGSFSLMSRRFVGEFNRLHETNRFIPGLRAYIGFDAGYVVYNKEKRYSGHTKQTLRKLTNLAFNAFFLFSNGPLWLSNALVWAALVALVVGVAFPSVEIVRSNIQLVLTMIAILQLWVVAVTLAKAQSEVLRRPPYIIQAIYEAEQTKQQS
jgi:dolichol-phosphate mannosyltransferase